MNAGEEVGRRLRDARKERGLTQSRIAKRAGLTRETISRAERGRLPSADTASRICNAIGIDRSEIDLKVPATDAIATHPETTSLRSRRRELGKTLAECAAAAGISAATLSRFERGIEHSRALVRMDQAGRPVELVNVGLASALGFPDVGALSRYWKSGR
ncbi:helix-turn-helix transcriptional regulator [Sphingomonas sp.]|uniref:helix-turn-helix transcriptional regulator n=1 Tax=Sphingomonas sp. TaxID=28214 RepID=UPI003F729804